MIIHPLVEKKTILLPCSQQLARENTRRHTHRAPTLAGYSPPCPRATEPSPAGRRTWVYPLGIWERYWGFFHGGTPKMSKIDGLQRESGWLTLGILGHRYARSPFSRGKTNYISMAVFHSLMDRYGDFLKWGYPNSWMVYMGKSIYEWMMTGGTPILGNHRNMEDHRFS